MTFWILLGGILVVGAVLCGYWLVQASREWALYEELIGRGK